MDIRIIRFSLYNKMKNFGTISYTSIRIYSLFKSWLKKFGFALSEFICEGSSRQGEVDL